ncbi:hypothetical protein B0H14DRAFT_2947232 [Mycena olivaceomarginata]|nr:hypothetical protein B0H14DRAFT_2947232 [Mycena olivaceomarginata]
MMNNLSTFDTVGWNHNVSYKLPHRMPGIPPRKIRLTLNLVAQVVHVIDTQYAESKVYTPMDVDDPGYYNPTNVDEPRVYTPMDVDETYEHILRNNYPGMSVGFDSVPGLTAGIRGPFRPGKRIYKKKWAILRQNKQLLFPFQFRHIPWPIFRSDENNIEINTPSVESFIFGEETRGIPSTCGSRRLAKQNLKLFHSDKFALILDRVLLLDRECARHCAEARGEPQPVGEYGQ